ncbi:hypothetical protein [Actinomadura fibrosa]|uniref:Uncharacterized protein n=1 Tax=Actinomadura fibrosa TaxID=111802 RepID=A0ABW2XGS2_9ACTN|nr:hypothetical protein [Actinomadura fibrosa]
MRIGELARITGTTPRARVRDIRKLLAVGLTLDDVLVFSACLSGGARLPGFVQDVRPTS